MISRLELKRQIFHIASCLIFVILIYYNIIGIKTLLTLLIIGYILAIISMKKRIPFISWLLDNFERQHNLQKFPGIGALVYLLGIVIVVLFFEKNIALASIIILGLGDSIAPLIGQFGKVKHPFSDKKFIEGVIAGIIAATLGAMFFVPWAHALAASTLAMIAEGIDIELRGYKLDDNLIIPIVSAIVLWVITLI